MSQRVEPTGCDGTTIAITARKEAESKIRRLNENLERRVEERTGEVSRQKTLFQAIFDNIPDATVITDEDHRIVRCNPAMAEIFGYDADEIVGLQTSVLYEKATEYEQESKRRLRPKTHIRPHPYTVSYRRKNGEIFAGETVGAPIMGPDGNILGFLDLMRDITERKKVEIQLCQAKEEAETANEAKSGFLSNMSHELRTPMNAILGFGQLLEMSGKTRLNEQQRDYVGHIMRSGRHLLDLINEVLDLSKIESGKMSLSPEIIELADCLGECIDMIKPQAAERNIRLIKRPDRPDLPTIRADYTRLKQVLMNLLSNAVKYNRHGGSVTVDCIESDNGMLRVSIADTGHGIPEDRWKDLYQPFNRLEAENCGIEGTGVGLTITKKLVELMGGRIGLDSVVGEGSTFWFEIPISGEAAPGRPADGNGEAKASEPSSATSTPTMLYVEDNPSNLRLMEEIISQASNINLLIARTAETGLKLAKARQPDVIVMDINLPGMDGYEALAALKSLKATEKIPILALSANATSKDIQKGLDAGFLAYLTKPVNIQKILDAINDVLGFRENNVLRLDEEIMKRAAGRNGA